MDHPSMLGAKRDNCARSSRVVGNFCAMCVLMLVFIPALAELPPPINLRVWGATAEASIWPWATVARRIIAWKHGGLTGAPRECALVAMSQGARPEICCAGPNPACLVTGSIPQIQMLMASFGANSSMMAPPKNPMDLYNILSSGRPMILQINSGTGMSHVVIIQGIEWRETASGPRALLSVGDPMNLFLDAVPFETIASLWMTGFAVN